MMLMIPFSFLRSSLSVFWPKEKFDCTASVADAAFVGLKKYIHVCTKISLQIHILHYTLGF